MAGIHFDITADNSHFIQTITQIQNSVRQTSSVLGKIGENFNVEGIENQVISLTKVIQDQEASIQRSKERIVKWLEEANEIRNTGDTGTFEAITKDIEAEAQSMQKLIDETNKYKAALNELLTLNGQSQGVRAPMFFGNQEDFEAYNEMLRKREEIQSRIANFDGEGMSERQQTARIVEMRSELTVLNAEINKTELAAANAAQALGTNGERAAEAAVRYYELNRAVEEQVAKINDLQLKLNTASDNLVTAVNAKDVEGARDAQIEYDNLTESLQSAKMELINLQGEQKQASEAFKEYGDTTQTLRMQLRECTMELTALTLQYRQMSDEERNSAAGKEMKAKMEELAEQAGELRDTLSDVSKEISKRASDTGALDSLAGGINVVTSSIGAFHGVLAMVGVDEKDLLDIQAKLQASLAISNALTVVQNQLQRESALMIGINTIQKKAAVVAENLDSVAKGKNIVVTMAATAAQKAFNIVAKANPYVLLATAILTVVGALAAFTLGTKKSNEEEEEAKRKAEELREEQNRLYADYTKNVSNLKSSYMELQTQWNSLSSDQERAKWVTENKDKFAELGLKVNDVKDAEAVLVTNTSTVIKSMLLRAKAAYQAAQAQAAYERALSGKIDENTRTVNAEQARWMMNQGYAVTEKGGGMWFAEAEGIKAYNAALESVADLNFTNAQYGIMDLNKEADQLLGNYKKTKNEITKPTGGNKNDNKAKEDADRQAKEKQQAWKHAEEMVKLEQDAARAREDASIAGIQSQAQRERAEREAQHKRTIADLKQQEQDIYKKIYQDRKTAYDNANKGKKNPTPYELTEEGSKGWGKDEEGNYVMAGTLKGDELSYYKEAVSKILSEITVEETRYTREQIEREQQIIASHQSYTDAKLAIDKKYREDVEKIDSAIVDAEKRGDKETVEALKRAKAEAQKDRVKSQADLTFKQLQEDPEYIRAFEDLDNVSTETLEHLIEMFEEAKTAAARSLDPKDLKQYTDTIEQMWDSIRKNDPSHALIVARENWKKANDKVKKAESDLYNVRRGGFRMMTVYNKETKEYEQRLMTIADAEKSLSIAKEERKKATKKLSLADEEARKIIDELADSVGNLGSMIGGTAGEILGAVSSVAKYTTTIFTAHDQIAKLGTSALDTFQKASVVLSLITTGMQIAQSIASLFSSNLEEIIAKNKMLAQMAIAVSNYRLEVEKAMREEDQWFSSTKLQGIVNQWQSSTDAAAEYFNYIKHAQEDYDKTVKQYSYVGVGEYFEKFVHSGDYFNALVNTGDGYASLQALVKATFNEDLFGADGLINVDVAKKAIEVWGDQIQGEGRAIIEHLIELAEEGTSKWMESLREYVSELYSPIADDLTDALFEWYETGVDVMDAFNDKARDTFQDVAKEMMKQLVNTMVFDELKNKLIAAYTVYAQTVSAGPEAGSANSNNTQDALNALRASLNAALIEFENTTKEALPELQAFMELLGQMSDDIFGQASDDLPDYFDNIKSAWQSTLLDMKGDAEQLGKEIARIMFESLVQKNVLNDEFNEWLKGWVERYEAAMNAESEAERNALLAKLYDERAEKVEELTDRTKEYAEMAGYAADADEQLTNSLENLKDTLLDSLLDAESDAGDLGKKIAQSLIKDMLTEMLAAEKYANQIEAIHELWQNILVGGGSWTNENGETFDMQSVLGMIAKLNNDIAEDESIAALADQYKQLTEEINGANTSFGDFHDSFMDALLDMENGAESFKKKLHETLVKDIIDKKVFGEAFAINGNPYENFEEYQKDWTKRYLDALEAGDTDLMRELVKEMEERETAMAEAAEQYAKELQEAAKDTTFTGMSDTFLSALMDTNKTAEDWAQDIGKTIAKKIFEGMVAEKTLLQGIQDVWDAAVAGATDESGKVDWDKVLANAELQQVTGSTKEEFENLQKAWEALCESLGVTLDAKELPLSDLGSTILESLTDAEESAEDFGKKIALKLMNEMLSELVNTRYLDEMKAIREMWQHALNGDVDEEGNVYTIERVTQAIEALRAEISGSTEISNLATQIQDLSKASAQADESFKSMGDSWTSVLTDMDATAEDFGRQIGQNLVSKLVKELIIDKELQFYLNNIQDAYNQAIESGMSLEDAVAAVEPKIDEAVEATEKWKPVIDSINASFQKLGETSTPFDNLRSSFLSALMDMSGDTENFAKDLNKSITEAFVDSFVLADFDDKLKEWKEKYASIQNDNISEEERARRLRELQEEIVAAKEGYVKNAREIQDYMAYGEYQDQNATVNMADKATYDQFETYLGIAVSQQITGEQQLNIQQQILSTLQGMCKLTNPNDNPLLTQAALANEYLKMISDSTRAIESSFNDRIASLEAKLAPLSNLR